MKITILSQLNFPGTLAKNQFIIKVRVYFWTLNSILIYMSILMPVLCCLDYCCFLINFESESFRFVLFHDFFVIPGPTHSHMNFKIKLWISGKNKASLDIDRNYVEYGTLLLYIYIYNVYNCYVFLKDYRFIIMKWFSLYLVTVCPKVLFFFFCIVISTPTLFCILFAWYWYIFSYSFTFNLFVYLNLKYGFC